MLIKCFYKLYQFKHIDFLLYQLFQTEEKNMNIKLDPSYFMLLTKPSIINQITYRQSSEQSDFDIIKSNWNFTNFNQFVNIDVAIQKFMKLTLQKIQQINIKNLNYSNESLTFSKSQQQKILQILQDLKIFFIKCDYYDIRLTCNTLFAQKNGLLSLYSYPSSFNIPSKLKQLEKTVNLFQDREFLSLISQNLISIQLLHQVCIKTITKVLRSLKQNLFVPTNDLFQQFVQTHKIKYNQKECLKQNLINNSFNKNEKQFQMFYYQCLIYKEVSEMEGLCHYLNYTKNILLDKKSGALSVDHQTWVHIYDVCLKIYARNQQVRHNHWLQIDQILSNHHYDPEFTHFICNSNTNDFSLASLNFYIKNLTKNQQEKLYTIIQQKIAALIQSGNFWKYAEDIVEYLDNQCPHGRKQQIFNKLIQLIQQIFVVQQQKQTNNDIEIEIGLSFMIESMCKNLQVTEKIFNKTNINIILQLLKGNLQTDYKIKLLHHILCQFIIHSYEQSDELSSYLQENPQIINQTFPQLIEQFRKYDYLLPKQFYKLIFNSTSDIENLKEQVWKGLAEIYFIQSFQQTIQMEIFHTENQSKRKITNHVTDFIKIVSLNHDREIIQLAKFIQFDQQNSQFKQSFLAFKAFKDNLIFSNVLLMSTFFADNFPLPEISSLLADFYSPLVPGIRWKSGQNENLTLLSFVCEQLPIDILKTTYKSLKQGFEIDWNILGSLSNNFWQLYLSKQGQNKIKAILQQKCFTFDKYQSLHNLRKLQLFLNMINCVFDKLNESSQKSIKQLKIMYQWGINYIRQVQPKLYTIFIDCVANKFINIMETFSIKQLQMVQLCNKTKNISVLDLHLNQYFHLFQTFNDFNRIGFVIQSQKAIEIQTLMHPAFLDKTIDKHVDQSISNDNIKQKQFINIVLQVLVIVENSCLQEVINQDLINKVSEINRKIQNYYQKSNKCFQKLKILLKRFQRQKFLQNCLLKRLMSHLKLLLGKIYIPLLINQSFIKNNKQQMPLMTPSKRSKSLQNKFFLIENVIQNVHLIDNSFEEHFAELMQIIQENFQTQNKNQDNQYINKRIQILLHALEMFVRCVLQNIRVRSYHIYRLIKLYLKCTNTQIAKFNQVIAYYIELLFKVFLSESSQAVFNSQIKRLSIQSASSTQKLSIYSPQKSKQLSFADRILSPLRREKISLQQLKVQRQNKKPSPIKLERQNEQKGDIKPSQQKSLIPPQLRRLIIQKNELNIVETSCTLSMFINLFSRLNYGSLPSGIQKMLTKENDKIVYLDYLIQLTNKINSLKSNDISSRDLQILSVDVYGNLACILKGKINQQIMKKSVELAKLTLKLNLPLQTIGNLPIRLINQMLFKKSLLKRLGLKQQLVQINRMSKFIEEFEEQPLAFELSLKSHILKIIPQVKSNIHLCNLEYIVGQSKGSVIQKIMQTNSKLLQGLMTRASSKILLKKYEKQGFIKETLKIQIGVKAFDEINRILDNFAGSYHKISSQRQETSKKQQIRRFYFIFKKICSLIFYIPELFSHVIRKDITVGQKSMKFVDIIIETLKDSLIIFCEFYIVSMKINSGFIHKDNLINLLQTYLVVENDQDSTFAQIINNMTQMVPLNMLFQAYIKLTLHHMIQKPCQNSLNIFRALNFTLKQSQPYRFRFYRFIRVNLAVNEQFTKKIDTFVLNNLLLTMNNHKNCLSFVGRIQMMDLCLQNLFSHTIFDYAKVKLDQKLKESFFHSQYSLKCLKQTNNAFEINTLKILQEAQQQKSVQSQQNYQRQEQVASQEQFFDQQQARHQKFQQIKQIIEIKFSFPECVPKQRQRQVQLTRDQNQFCTPKKQQTLIQSNNLGQMIYMCQQQVISIKQLSELRQWFKISSQSANKISINRDLLIQLNKQCQHLIGKDNYELNFEGSIDYEGINQIGNQPLSNEQISSIPSFTFNQSRMQNQIHSIVQENDCIQQNQTSFIQNQVQSQQRINHDQGMIVQSQDSIQNNHQVQSSQLLFTTTHNQSYIGFIIQNDYQQNDGIIQEQQSENDQQSQYNNQPCDIQIIEDQNSRKNSTGRLNIIGINNGNIRNATQQEAQNQSDNKIGTDGSIQLMPSIKSLQQSCSTLVLAQLPSQSRPPAPHLARQYHYTIDNFTNQPSTQLLYPIQATFQSTQTMDLREDMPANKENILLLIQEYTLNPQLLRVIKIKLKKITTQELKKVHVMAAGQVRESVEKEMRVRGIYVQTFGPNDQYQQGSLFSISRLVNQSYQIDQSKFYVSNAKKCHKKQQILKIQLIPLLQYSYWAELIQLYIVKSLKPNQKSDHDNLKNITFLQEKHFNELIIKLLLRKQNLLIFLQVLLNILSLKNRQQIIQFFQHNSFNKYSYLVNDQRIQFVQQVSNCILNGLVTKLIANRIGLPVIFKGKWHKQTKKLIRSQYQCLVSDSNLNNTKNQGQPLLQVLLRKSIQLTQSRLKLNSQSQKAWQPLCLIKSLKQYLQSCSTFQTNNYPYYMIQDTIKLTQNTHSSYSHSSSSKSSTLIGFLINSMKQSPVQMLDKYEDIFYIVNYLDFQTFSQFLQLLLQNNRDLCEKILDKELNILRRFNKTLPNITQINNQKIAEMYWHMRKSAKGFNDSAQQQQQQKLLKFLTSVLSSFCSKIFSSFKQSIFSFGYGKQQTKRKQQISILNKKLLNPAYATSNKQIKQSILSLEKDFILWKGNKVNQILKEDIIPVVEKILSGFYGCLKKWETLFQELDAIFGTDKDEKFILYKQAADFYRVFLSFQMLLQEETTSMRSMSSLKTKPSLQSTRQMVTGRRRSSLRLPNRVSLNLGLPNFKQTLKKMGPKFSFFSEMFDASTCSQLKIHAKYSSLQSKLKLLKQKKNIKGQRTIQIRRQYVWFDTMIEIDDNFGQQDIKIKIGQEIGLDYGGLRREWITLLVRQLVNPQLGLFQLSANGLSFQPSRTSHLVPNHLYHFHKFGMLVGKALKQGWLLQINFTKSFLKHLLGFTLYVQDLQDIDPDTTKSLLWILNNEVDENLGIDFTIEFQSLGKKTQVQLVQNARQIYVNQSNKKDYVKMLANYKMTQQIREQSKAFMSGLEKVISFDILKLFSYKELGMYLAGMPTVDVEQMRRTTRYQGFQQNHETVKWFWEVLLSYTQDQRANFLFYLTGSYKVPYGGFKQHPISINKMPASKDYLPVAHTCFSVIDLPQYSSKQKLSYLLQKAIQQGKGFSVS